MEWPDPCPPVHSVALCYVLHGGTALLVRVVLGMVVCPDKNLAGMSCPHQCSAMPELNSMQSKGCLPALLPGDPPFHCRVLRAETAF